MKNKINYTLNSKQGKGECPQCGDKKSFTYYRNEATGEILHESVGRCDHENSCRYHKKPKDFFSENPQIRYICKPEKISIPKKESYIVNYIPEEFVTRYYNQTSTLEHYFQQRYEEDPVKIKEAFQKYRVVGSGDNTVFLQIDRANNIRTGKVFHYQSNLHRSKIKSIDWLHCKNFNDNTTIPKEERIKQEKEEKGFHLKQCLFGEHLLTTSNLLNLDRIIVVESEKTAVLCSILYPMNIWLATGSCGGFKAENFASIERILKLHKYRKPIMVYPDKGFTDKWKEKAYYIKRKCPYIDFLVSDTLETRHEIKNNDDIFDFFEPSLKLRK